MAMLERLQDCGVLGDGEVQCPEALGTFRDACLASCFEATSCDELVETVCLGPIGTTWDPIIRCHAEQCLGQELSTCANGEVAVVCNGIGDCPDGSDEAGCEQYACADGVMIPAVRECDGFRQCNGGEDEEDCAEEYSFTCDDGTTLHPNFVCNGEFDCQNGEDEQVCWPVFLLYCPDATSP